MNRNPMDFSDLENTADLDAEQDARTRTTEEAVEATAELHWAIPVSRRRSRNDDRRGRVPADVSRRRDRRRIAPSWDQS